MKKQNALLNLYSYSDELHRLHLFLEHPDYRVRFLEIDLVKTSAVQSVQSVVRFKWLKNLFYRYLKPVKASR